MIPIVQSNIAAFRNYLYEIDLPLNEEQNSDGTPYFATNERTENGANIRLVVAFLPDHPSIDVYCFNLADITNPLKREIALKHINDLNTNYRYTKFTMNDEGAIVIQSSIDFNENFDPSIVVKHVQMIYRAANEEYRHFMKIAWA
jgi:hypothetical protein